jgi:transcriptional regulator with XRE-family HTH domain
MAGSEPGSAQLHIGKAIRSRRRELGLSLGSLAAELGVALSTVSKLENGLVAITFERLDAISKILKVDMAALLSDQAKSAASISADAAPATREIFGARRSVTRSDTAVRVEGGVYTLSFHATDLLDKRVQPATAEIHITDIKDYGPYTHHPGEEFNYVMSGEVEFHTDVYSPLRLKAGDSIYFDAEMGHAHIRVGSEKCVIIAVLIPRTAEMAKNNTAPILEIARAHGIIEPKEGKRLKKSRA